MDSSKQSPIVNLIRVTIYQYQFIKILAIILILWIVPWHIVLREVCDVSDLACHHHLFELGICTFRLKRKAYTASKVTSLAVTFDSSSC